MHDLRTMSLLVIPILLFGALVSAAAQESGGDADNPFTELGLPEIAVTLTEQAIEGAPDELTAGRYLLAVTNTIPAPSSEMGPPVAGVTFVQVPADQSAEDFVVQLGPPPGEGSDAASPPAGPPPAPPAWYYETTLSGGPYVMPDQTSYAVIDLTPGAWVLWGRSFAAAPAPALVTVTGEAPADQPAPEAAVRIDMAEYSFTATPGLAAGPQIIEVVNVGVQPHFLSITGVPAGTTVDDVLALFGMGAEPGATPASGLSFEDLVVTVDTTEQSNGVTAWYAADLAPGTYLLACYVPDPGSGAPHAMLGMMQIVEVE